LIFRSNEVSLLYPSHIDFTDNTPQFIAGTTVTVVSQQIVGTYMKSLKNGEVENKVSISSFELA